MIDDEQQIVEPMAFIPVAERYNLMPAVDRLVISTAFAEFARIVARGRPRRRASMGHQPVRRVVEPRTISWSSCATSSSCTGVPHSAICFEITETAAIANLAKATHLIHELKAARLRLLAGRFRQRHVVVRATSSTCRSIT